MKKRRRRPARYRQIVPPYGTGCVIALSSKRTIEPVSHRMHPQPDHIPEALTLARRPTRDDREEELAQLRTADGRILALVERVDPASLVN